MTMIDGCRPRASLLVFTGLFLSLGAIGCSSSPTTKPHSGTDAGAVAGGSEGTPFASGGTTGMGGAVGTDGVVGPAGTGGTTGSSGSGGTGSGGAVAGVGGFGAGGVGSGGSGSGPDPVVSGVAPVEAPNEGDWGGMIHPEDFPFIARPRGGSICYPVATQPSEEARTVDETRGP